MASHVRSSLEHHRRISATERRETVKFPEFDYQFSSSPPEFEEELSTIPSHATNSLAGRVSLDDRWRPKQSDSANVRWPPAGRHSRQKSLSEAIMTVRTRRGSVSQNAVEIAEALKAPVSFKLVFLCGLWYGCSILTNASSKAILTALPRPVTLTIVQFFLVSTCCVCASVLARMFEPIRAAAPVLKYGIRRPSKDLIMVTLPLTAFQIGGHIMNSDAMSRIPVSLVHTIKGLSPMFTVVAYRLFFGIHYSMATYASLIPLTLGVVMACSASFRAEFWGLFNAFGSALLFVTQNIVSKTLFTEAASAEADGVPLRLRKPDKLNLLCYSSGLALILTLPIWLWSEGLGLIGDFFADASVELSGRPGSLDHGRLAVEFVFNGVFHFTQSLLAFVLLGMTSPVTYSVASLIKRVFVIVFAVIWWGNPMSRIQASGIGLTIVGLYLYDRVSDADKADKRLRAQQQSGVPLLPTTISGETKRSDTVDATIDSNTVPFINGMSLGKEADRRTTPQSMMKSGALSSWLPPGTKQEDTWGRDDVMMREQAIDVR